MPTRTGKAQWKGSLEEGSGTVSFADYNGNYSVPSRFEDGEGTNPEEMIGAAHAGCFSMALSMLLGEEGYEPKSIDTSADVTVEKQGEGFAITSITLKTEADVPDIDNNTFQNAAEAAKENCPVSKALAGTDIGLEAQLK